MQSPSKDRGLRWSPALRCSPASLGSLALARPEITPVEIPAGVCTLHCVMASWLWFWVWVWPCAASVREGKMVTCKQKGTRAGGRAGKQSRNWQDHTPGAIFHLHRRPSDRKTLRRSLHVASCWKHSWILVLSTLSPSSCCTPMTTCCKEGNSVARRASGGGVSTPLHATCRGAGGKSGVGARHVVKAGTGWALPCGIARGAWQGKGQSYRGSHMLMQTKAQGSGLVDGQNHASS